jgi:hypothetical protein
MRSGAKWSQRSRQRGQTLVIFALSFTVLLGLAGLAIDVGRVYDLYARMQRAAEAGALAGVLYMPGYYDVIRPGDVDSAVSRASKEIVKDGFGTALAPTASACSPGAEISICSVTGKSDDLRVTITETLDLVLLSGLGVQPVTLHATAQAEYLPPIQIGARLNYFGDQVECYNTPSTPDPTQTSSCSVGTGTPLQSFLASFNGPNGLKENGDPFVYCEEGPAYSTTPDGAANSYTTYNGYQTNHATYADSITNHCGQPSPGITPGNPDQQPPGFAGEATRNTAHPGGYNYLISVPAGGGDATIWVFNPSFIPSGTGGTFDHFNVGQSGDTAYFKGPNGNGIKSFNGSFDAPPFYYNVTYSLYHVTSIYDRSTDQLVGSALTYPPYDAESADVTLHCGSGFQGVYYPYWNGGATANDYNPPVVAGSGCLTLSTSAPGTGYGANTPAPCWQQWCALYASLTPGTYRFVIEATGLISSTSAYTSTLTSGNGAHIYALKVCPSTSATPISCPGGASGGNPGLALAAWNNMDFYFSSQLTKGPPNANDPSTTCTTQAAPATGYTCLDLACIPTSYAGRTLSVQFFDPGDGSGDLYIGLAEAGVGTPSVSYPGLAASYISTIDGDTVVQAHFSSPSYTAFNGIWLTAAVTLPSSYTGNCQSGPGGTGWWQMIYASANGTPGDQVGVKFSLTGSPIHLLS